MAGSDGDPGTATADGDGPDEDEAEADHATAPHGLFLAPLVLLEVAFVGWVLSVVVRSLLGGTTPVDTVSAGLRLAAVAFLAVEMVVPLVVYVDLLRRPDDPDFEWVHATLIPVVNVLGAIAYLEDRRRRLGG